RRPDRIRVRCQEDRAPGAHMTSPGSPMEGIAAVSWGPDRIDLFWVAADRSLVHRWWDGAMWSADENLGGELAAAPTVTSWAANEMEVFAVFGDGQLYNIYWDGG